MTVSIDWSNKIIESTESITDLPTFHSVLRNMEESVTGAIYPVTHTWKALDQGGGAFIYQADSINGYKLKFTLPGTYVISGNLNIEIVPLSGVYVERRTSTAYITTAVGAVGPTPSSIADEVWGRQTETFTTTGSIGNFITKLLTVVKFLGLK